jgi:V8-like Glu-specific endopeptidase
VDVVAREESGREVAWTCTGTLLPHGYVLTNHHCIPGHGPGQPVRASILMNYLEQDGRDARRFDLSVTPVETDEKLDFAIVSVHGDASEFEGVLLSDAPVQPDQSLIVIHHPEQRPMVMTRFRCQAFSEQPDQSALRHRCDTLPGSSGAMIFTSGHVGVALHFAGGLQPGDEHSFNLSTRITALASVSPTIRASLAARDGGTLAIESHGVQRPAGPVSVNPDAANPGSANPGHAESGHVDPTSLIRQ